MATPLRNIKVTIQAPPVPPNTVLTADTGEWEQSAGVNHVSVFPPLTLKNGGPGQQYRYRIAAELAATGQAIQLQQMWFVGYSSQTGAARFADQT